MSKYTQLGEPGDAISLMSNMGLFQPSFSLTRSLFLSLSSEGLL